MGRNITEAIAGTSHELVRHTHFQGNNYFNTSGSTRYDWWRCSFTKELGASESYLVVNGMVMGTNMHNYPNIGQYCTLDHWGVGSSSSDADQRAYGGYYFCGPPGSDDEQVIIIIQKVFKADDLSPDPHPNMVGTFPSSALGAGSHTLDLGCGSSNSVRPMQHWNISWVTSNASYDVRQHQQGARLSIMEYRY